MWYLCDYTDNSIKCFNENLEYKTFSFNEINQLHLYGHFDSLVTFRNVHCIPVVRPEWVLSEELQSEYIASYNRETLKEMIAGETKDCLKLIKEDNCIYYADFVNNNVVKKSLDYVLIRKDKILPCYMCDNFLGKFKLYLHLNTQKNFNICGFDDVFNFLEKSVSIKETNKHYLGVVKLDDSWYIGFKGLIGVVYSRLDEVIYQFSRY